MRRYIILFLISLINIPLFADIFYIATTGSDSYDGTAPAHVSGTTGPWATWAYAEDMAEAGDTVYARGGVWYPTGSASVAYFDTNSGTYENPICFFNYPGETPIIDGTYRDLSGNWNSCFTLSRVNFVKFKGLTIRNFWQPSNGNNAAAGIGASECSNLSFENMTVYNIGGCAYKVFGAWRYPAGGFTYPTDGFDTATWHQAGRTYGYYLPAHGSIDADTMRFINCDAHDVCDSSSIAVGPGGSADGYKLDNEVDAVFIITGCRAWDCSDDGFDISGTGKAIYTNNWSVRNGKLEGGDGNGYKDAYPRAYMATPIRVHNNNISAFNRAIGFTVPVADDYPCMAFTYYNNTAYKNYRAYVTSFGYGCAEVQSMIFRNNIRYGHTGPEGGSFKDGTTSDHNSWNGIVTVTDDDFVLIDSASSIAELTASRNADFSLPTLTFMTLAVGSDLIDAGVDVGLDYTGTAPDMGYAEYGTTAIDSTKKYILSYSFPEQTGLSVIDSSAKTVDIEVEYGTDVTGLIATFSLSTGATAAVGATPQVSGTTANNFTSPVTYVVTALNATTQNWTITVTVESEPTPTVATVSADYNAVSANITGRIYSANGGTLTARGVCYSTTNSSPTTSDRHTTFTPYVGSFTDKIYGLRGGTTYYFRAYGTTSEGGTSYGDAISFTTPAKSWIGGFRIGNKAVYIE